MAKKDKGLLTGDPITYQTPSPAGGVQIETFIPWTLVKRGVKRQVITPIDAPEQFQVEATVERQERKAAQDTPLIRALGLAHHWQRLLDDGKVQTIADIAQMEGIDVTQVRRLLARLGIAAEVNARAVAIPMGFTGEKVASGEADIAIQQVSELMSVPGVAVAGPFPPEVQTVSTFDAAIFAERRARLAVL